MTTNGNAEQFIPERVDAGVGIAAFVREPAPEHGLLMAGSTHASQPHPAVDFSVHCFGEFRLWRAGQRVMLPRAQKTVPILRYLILRQDKPITREALLELGWPDEPTASAAARLNTTLSVLRKALASELDDEPEGSSILHDEGVYRLNPDLRLQVDVAEFDAWYTQSLVYERSGRLAEAVLTYRAAIELYRGPIALGDCYDHWLLIERERLASTYF
jgi:DNA-binding SARP family transcriptional activator